MVWEYTGYKWSHYHFQLTDETTYKCSTQGSWMVMKSVKNVSFFVLVLFSRISYHVEISSYKEEGSMFVVIQHLSQNWFFFSFFNWVLPCLPHCPGSHCGLVWPWTPDLWDTCMHHPSSKVWILKNNIVVYACVWMRTWVLGLELGLSGCMSRTLSTGPSLCPWIFQRFKELSLLL